MWKKRAASMLLFPDLGLMSWSYLECKFEVLCYLANHSGRSIESASFRKSIMIRYSRI